MPTGFTAPVYDNKRVTAKELAEGFARGLGFTIHQKDQSIDAAPSYRKPSPYYSKAVFNLKAERREVVAASAEQLKMWQEREAAEVQASNERERIRHENLRERYDYAIAVFEAWKPETESGQSVKRYALDQLQESRNHDARGKPFQRSVPEIIDPETFRQQLLDKLDQKIADAEHRYEEEIRLADEANRRIDDFYKDVQRLEGIRLDT